MLEGLKNGIDESSFKYVFEVRAIAMSKGLKDFYR